MAMESGCRRRCEQDAVPSELCAALSLQSLSTEQLRSDTVALAPGALNHQGELLVARRGRLGVKFQCPSRKDPFEARMRISSQHTQALPRRYH
jgi:hypothetical protein